MKKAFVMMLCAVALFGAEKSMEELEKENRALEMQLKNQKLKKELEESSKSDEEKRAEKVAEAKEILQEAFKGPSKDDKRSGGFGGVGFGGVTMGFPDSWSRNYDELHAMNGFALDIQGGYMTMWNRHFGLQYYTNLDFGFVNLTPKAFESKGFLWTTTMNVDAILNAYNGDAFGIGFLAGLGLGVKYSAVEHTSRIQDKFLQKGSFGFDARFNLGMRLIFGSRFAIDFMARFPFTTEKFEAIKGSYREIATYTVRFVGGRF